MKLGKKFYIIVGAVLLGMGLFFLLRDGDAPIEFIEVQRGDLTQEVFETGEVKKGDDIMLGFNEGGRIENLFIERGDFVEKGDIIATLETESLEISLREAKASLSSTKAVLSQTLRGASDEEINSAKARVNSAKSALETAKEDLENTERTAEETLEDIYKNVPFLLSEVYFDAKSTEEEVDEITKKYFTGLFISETYSARASRDAIKRSVKVIEDYRTLIVEEENNYSEKDEAMRITEEELRKIIKEVDNIIDITEADFYEDKVTTADKEILKTERRKTNSNLDSVISLKQSITLTKSSTNATLTSARGQKTTAERNLEEAERALEQVTAQASQEEVRQVESAVEQAQSRVDLLEKRLRDSTLKAPANGVISNIFKRRGEVAGVGEPISRMTIEEDFQIEIFIYEGDVPKVSVGDTAEVSFVAFPNTVFTGEVISINPTGEIKDGIIYYETILILSDYPENVLANMTVDVVILTDRKEDVLYIPERVVYRENGTPYVDVLIGEEVEKREVTLGMRGEGRLIEVEGVKEGERVIVK